MKQSVLILAVALGGLGWQATAETKIDFVKDIQPLLEQNCVKCHGPEKQKGDLRLDSKAAAMKGGKGGVAIVANDASKSDLYRRITLPAGDDDIMPSKGDPLTKAQADLIKEWINQGAVWPDGAVAKSAGETAAPIESPFAMLGTPAPTPGEAAAISKLEASGVSVRPVAMNLKWREANFHTLGTNVTDTTIAPIKEVVTLVDLNLAGTLITDAGLQNLSGLSNLVTLHLEHTKISDAGLEQLKNLPHLAYLNLFDTSITDQGLAQIKGLSSLKRIYLWQTKVTDQGATELQKSLPKVQISRGWENDPAAKEMLAKKEEAKTEKKDEKKEEKK